MERVHIPGENCIARDQRLIDEIMAIGELGTWAHRANHSPCPQTCVISPLQTTTPS